MKLNLSQSRLNTFEKCPRQYYYYYNLKYYGEQTSSTPLEFGILVHNLMEQAFNYEEGDRKEYLTSITLNKVSEIEDDPSKDYSMRLFNLLPSLKRAIDTFNVLQSEKYVQVMMFAVEDFNQEIIKSIVNRLEKQGKVGDFEGIFFGGYLDAHAIEDGKTSVIDWKTGKFSRRWISPYERQIILYTHIMRMNDFEIDQAKIMYLEQNYEHVVDVSVQNCRTVFEKSKNAFRGIIERMDDIENFEMIKEEAKCNQCSYSFICHR